ncbi:ATP-binding cassette domain-containing protein [Acuticoccus sp. M5D2P5]|uniref:ABC transporter ATP-binding protein n=1 Tax=Acuticoccus kalidii TaxID=2910977 RepID=UPI001F476EB6|nr:ATP-binding cassette domain-containing protein [Acuticoccus kalidii]MCF3935497.1 ATP-binding cassette domain-containing protein [Acuticoccus kalidii]
MRAPSAPETMGLPLEIADLAVWADGGRRLLSIEALALAPGACLGVAGPSGAGKSTFLYALAGLSPRATGRIGWGEVDLLALSRGRRAAFRRDNMGFVFQDFLLFEELGATANAALLGAFLPARRRGALAARARAELAALNVPLDPPRRVRTYSGGERQRVALARALANDPGVILADEPTASLDRETKDRLVDDLTREVRASGKTMIAVSHDRALLDRMDRVLTIENGEVAG